MSAAIEQRNQDATVYVGNLDEKITEELLWELMLQAGPVVNVHMPKDKVTGQKMGYGFVEFRSEEDAEYAMKVMNMVKLHGKPMKLNKASADKRQIDVGANIFVGNLDTNEVDEKLLYDTFSAFGGILQTPKIMRDIDTGASKGYGFVSFDSFEASDLAIECMNGQFLCNRPIIVQYAFKKDTQGERHGSQAERMMAAGLQQQRFKPNTTFSSGDGDSVVNLAAVNPLLAVAPPVLPFAPPQPPVMYGGMAPPPLPYAMPPPVPAMPPAMPPAGFGMMMPPPLPPAPVYPGMY
jgi:splicing factor 3B subunit 4